jgi:hypothetical protein
MPPAGVIDSSCLNLKGFGSFKYTPLVRATVNHVAIVYAEL